MELGNDTRLFCLKKNNKLFLESENNIKYFCIFCPNHLRVTRYIQMHSMHIDCLFNVSINIYPDCPRSLSCATSVFAIRACTCLRYGLFGNNEKKPVYYSSKNLSLYIYFLSLFSLCVDRFFINPVDLFESI